MDNIRGELNEFRGYFREFRAEARTHFRILLFSLISGFVCVFGAMVKGFGWLN